MLGGWPWFEVAAMTHRSSATYAVLHDLFDEIIGVPPGADADTLATALANHLAINMGETAGEHGPYLRRFRDLPPIDGDARVLSGLARRDPPRDPQWPRSSPVAIGTGP
jgi:hypothetical protein